MAISYVSEVIKANPWVQPFDIELMTKVNAYKQGEFYKNAAKIENMVTQLNNADIANPEQRDYLKSKVSNLTTQLNNMGAINYSDTNIANTIEGFGSDIYSDDKVLNGIQSTKSIREWQKNVEKIKTDPKLNKFYSAANEAYDYEKFIKPYVSGGLEAKYEGPRSPKPYMGNPFTKVMEQLKTVRPDIETRIDPVTGNEFFFSKTEQRILKPEDIAAAVDGMVDGDTKKQLQIDAWYNYDYSTGYKFNKQLGLDIYTQDLDNKLEDKKNELISINEQIKAEPDINKKADWEKRRSEVQGDINIYTTKRGSMIKDFGKEFDESPDNAKYKLYMTRFQRDIQKAAGFSETKTSLIKNEERLFTARQQLEYTKNGLYWDGHSYNHDGTPLVLPVTGAEDMGKTGSKDGTGKTGIDPANGIFHDITQNTESGKEARANKVNEATLLRDNTIISDEQTSRLRSYLENTAKRGGYDLGFKSVVSTNADTAPTGEYSPLIEAIQTFGDKKYLDKQDIQTFLAQVTPKGTSAEISYNGKKLGVTKDQINFFRNVMKNWDAVATGQIKADEAPMNISTSDLNAFVKEYQTSELVKKSNLAYINTIYDQSLQGAGLTPDQIQRYKLIKAGKIVQGKVKEIPNLDILGMEQRNNISKNVHGVSPELAYLEGIMSKNGVSIKSLNKRIEDAFANASNRDNYYSLYLPDPAIIEKATPGLMAKVRAHAALEGSVENLHPTSISRTAEGKFVLSYTFGPDKKVKTGEVELDAPEARRLGAELYPNENLERLLTYETTTGPMFTYSGAFKQPIKYSIEREGNTRNGRTYIPYIYYGNERIPVFAPDKRGFQGSANAAEILLNNYITKNSARTIEEFVEGLKKLRNI